MHSLWECLGFFRYFFTSLFYCEQMDTPSLKKSTGPSVKETWLELTIQLCLHEPWTSYESGPVYDQWLHYNQFQSIAFVFLFHLDVVLRFHCLPTVSVGVSKLFQVICLSQHTWIIVVVIKLFRGRCWNSYRCRFFVLLHYLFSSFKAMGLLKKYIYFVFIFVFLQINLDLHLRTKESSRQ